MEFHLSDFRQFTRSEYGVTLFVDNGAFGIKIQLGSRELLIFRRRQLVANQVSGQSARIQENNT